ncbi:MAG: hypothetical protein JJT77_09225 [Crocinitomicaceae bacterium]|nr:hypothetical protein [Crocinitomicaceae bacterium]
MKRLFLSLFVFFSLSIALAQARELPKPPQNEPTPLFYFNPFERQPKIPYELEKAWQNLVKKKPINWNNNDSLAYAFELVYLQRFEHALFYFQRLDLSSIENINILELYHFMLKKNKRFEKLLDSYSVAKSMFPELKNVFEIRMQIADTRILHQERIWNIQKDHIFPELIDTTSLDLLAANSNYKIHPKLIEIAEQFDQALRYEILYCDETDKIISQAYIEYATFLHRYLYASNAYIAFNIARHFDKRNGQIPKRIKAIKKELEENNYLIPSFTVLFKKINPNNYALKEIQSIDSLQFIFETTDRFIRQEDLENYINKRPDKLPWLDNELLIIIVLATMLLCILIFIDVRKKKNLKKD